MEETHKRQCGNCGAEIQARHLGSVKIGDSDVAIGYCERCNHGIGRFGWHLDLPMASVDGFGVMYRGSFFDSNAAMLYFTVVGLDSSGDCLCEYLPPRLGLAPEENAYTAMGSHRSS